MPRSKEFVSSDESADSDASSEVNEKKSKKRQKKEHKDDKAASSKKPKKESKDEEEAGWELGNNRHVRVREFKGKLYVDIREMYFDNDGDMKPGRKGISLSMPQWRKFMDIVEEVDTATKSK